MKGNLYRWHKRIGLTLGIILFILGLSGAVVSYRDELMPVVYPQLFKVDVGAERAPVETVVINAQAYLNEEPLTHLYTSERDDTASMVFARPEGSLLPKLVTVDPYTAEVKGEMPLIQNIFGVMLYAHANLLLGKAGGYVVGVMGLLLVFFFGSGIYIFWGNNPLERIRRLPRAGVRGVHRGIGVFLGVPLLFAGITGFILAFDIFGGGRPEDMVRKDDCNFFQQIEIISKISKEDKDNLVSIHFCSVKNSLMKISIGHGERSGHHGFNKFVIEPKTGEVLQSFNSEKDPANWNVNALTIYPLHTGEFFGPVGRALVLLSGFGLMGLYLTGLFLGFRKKLFAKTKPTN